jgi:hypothetical protein
MKSLKIRTSISIIGFVRSFNGRMAMRLLMLCALCLFAFSLSGVVLAQIPSEDSSPRAEQTPAGFPGTYIFEWPDGRSVAEIELDGNVLSATLVISGGYTVHLRGTAQGNSAHGNIVGKSGTGDFGEFDAMVNENALQLALRPNEAEPLQLIFRRATVDESAATPEVTVPDQVSSPAPEEATVDTPSEATVSDPLSDSAPDEAAVDTPSEATVPDQPSSSVPEGVGGDNQLIGTWVYQSLITSGDASYASESFQTFHADGTYSYGKGSTVAGGGGWSYNGGNGDGDSENGYWRAQDGVIYTSSSNSQWYRIGKYGMTEDGSTMRITYDNGNKKLWSRR